MSRRIIAFNNVSADGYFAAPDGNLNWVVPDPELDKYVTRAGERGGGGAGAFLFGRKTYQMFASFWPHVLNESDSAPDPHTPGRASREMRAMAEMLNETPKIVFSKNLKEATWANSRIVRELDPREIARMKAEPGREGDMMIFGSGSIASLLTEHGLIDEYQFVVSPILLGKGRTLLSGVATSPKLVLEEDKSFPSGKILLRYTRPTLAMVPDEQGEETGTRPTQRKIAKAPPAKAVPALTPDSALAKVIGSGPMSRQEVTKKFWAYIKRKGLQDKQNKRMVNADDTLRPVFGGKARVDMADVPTLLDRHLKSKK